ncbi:unnamed protein product [Lupinus luteus]|uniref:Dormancy-associated protein homolog 4 n=1 Tax=Lupinus luteus TaxID=3873 RepID=A0AAV1X8U6_LUPLU
MGFLHKLWDETLAGPAPETGLGKLRKYNSFAVRPPVVTGDDVPISRSITIVRTHSNFRTTETSNPTSSSVPCSPRSPETPGGDFKKLTRRKSTSAVGNSKHRSPTIYHWVIMSAVDYC